jgi:hypothetical protein
MTDRWKTAVHEASHVAVGLATGATPVNANLETAEGYLGLTRMRYEKATPDSYFLVCLAGHAGELLLADSQHVDFVKLELSTALASSQHQDYRDFQSAAEQAVRYSRRGGTGGTGGNLRDLLEQDAIDQTIVLVQRNSRSIGRIAEHLHRLGDLPGQLLRQLHYEATALGWE